MSVTLDEDEETVLGLRPDGRPDPDYARALGLVPASTGRRSLAFAIDAIIVLILTLPLSLGALPLWLSLVLTEPVPDPSTIITDPAFITGLVFYAVGQGVLAIFVFVQVILHGIRGVTVGKAMVGIRSVNVARFGKPGFWRIVLRVTVFWAALAIIPLVGAIPFLLSPLWDPQKRGRGWLDRIGSNWLIDARRGLDPFDQKALRHARKAAASPAAAPAGRMPSLATAAAGAVPSFLPATRSNSGVISPRSDASSGAEPWQPPPVATPAAVSVPQQAPSRSGDPAASAEGTPPASRSTSAVIGFDDGMRVDVRGTGLIGRRPEARADERIDHLVAVADESRQISKTHVEFGVDDRGFWLVDRGSVNGTSVLSPGAAARELVSWQREHVTWNSQVQVGGRRFTVTAASTPTDGDA